MTWDKNEDANYFSTCTTYAIDVQSIMIIIETPIFTRRIQTILSGEEYRLLQIHLINKPDVGKIIPGSGGLRKLRWSAGGHGKSGGIRVIILLVCSDGRYSSAF